MVVVRMSDGSTYRVAKNLPEMRDALELRLIVIGREYGSDKEFHLHTRQIVWFAEDWLSPKMDQDATRPTES